MTNKINHLCTGCGLCIAVENGVRKVKDSKGFDFFITSNQFLKMGICPNYGKMNRELSKESIWGRILDVCYSYSSNPQIRKAASSGGTLTSLAMFLLDSKIIDGVLESVYIPPFGMKLCVVTKKEDLLKNVGSKYIDSANLATILSLIEKGKKYCFIGKPCEVTSLKALSVSSDALRNSIVLYLSFFCAGVPSIDANKQLIQSLGVNPDTVEKVQWRGNGWPGRFVVKSKNGEGSCSYEKAWGEFLGRNVRNSCRVCVDSIGELADISCCDGWYLNKEGKPIFDERDGRNATLIRSKAGQELFRLAVKKNYIIESGCLNFDEYLKKAQIYHFQRRASMKSMILAYKLCHKQYPICSKKVLKFYSKQICFRSRFRRFIGTYKRILLGKI